MGKLSLVILGAPGSGKGTQAKRISEKFSLPHISTGNILRDAISQGKKLGQQAKLYMDRGELVPDALVTGILEDLVGEGALDSGFILDGYPRNLEQAESLDIFLERRGIKNVKVLNIDLPFETIIKRLSGRRVCKKCGANFNVTTLSDSENASCSDCGGELYQRDDDKEETVRNRLSVYKRETEPLIDFYGEKDILMTVNGGGKPQDVGDGIIKALSMCI